MNRFGTRIVKSQPPPPTALPAGSGLVTIPDSYYGAIKQRLIDINAQTYVNGKMITQPMGGVIQARDWPMTPPIEGALYLLLLGINPVGGTEAQILYEFIAQWTWILIGTDINGNIAMNRGDRYRANMLTMSNLRQANYPQWTQKVSYSVDSETGDLSTAPVTSTEGYSEYESIWWTTLKFNPRQDNDKSGLLYGSATVSIRGYDDVLASIA